MMLLIFALSSLSDPQSPPGDLSDRWAHLLEYAVLGGLVLRAVARAEWGTVTASAAATAWIVSTLYGVTDEFHQWFVPGRVADPVDVVVDGAGAGLAVLLVLVWCKRMIR